MTHNFVKMSTLKERMFHLLFVYESSALGVFADIRLDFLVWDFLKIPPSERGVGNASKFRSFALFRRVVIETCFGPNSTVWTPPDTGLSAFSRKFDSLLNADSQQTNAATHRIGKFKIYSKILQNYAKFAWCAKSSKTCFGPRSAILKRILSQR